ncbi:putative SNAP25 homologous protein SNAP30 [Aristolochia californica]|uniref:putative SNAP25 homologous protein SNAP30 n=1 Tax=Aristolochia californica TaxID=171875 RepID=UPI0035D716B3
MEKMRERKITKQHSTGPTFSSYNPFDSDSDADSDSESEVVLSSATTRRQLSTPTTSKECPKSKSFLFRKDEERVTSSPDSSSVSLSEKIRCKSSFSDVRGIENQTSLELENYAVYKAEGASEKFKSCLKIAEDIREDAASTLVTTSKECPKSKPFLFRKDEERVTSSPGSSSVSLSEKIRCKSSFSDVRGIENQSSPELENYAVYMAEEASEKFKSCLKIAEDIREDAASTLVTLNQQGEQITQTHMEVTKIDHDLSLGEKLLGSLGGIFSKPWGPKKTRTITGPLIIRNDSSKSISNQEDRRRLGLTPSSRRQTTLQTSPSTPLEKVEVEKAKQDDALSDLSNLLSQLKDMAVDMGSEVGRHSKALDHFNDDVDELNFRLKGANQRSRRLLRK